MCEAPLVFEPEMLVVRIVLVIGLLVRSGHGLDDGGRVMPHQRLKELVTPPDTYLIMPVDVIPFGLCLRREDNAGQSQKDYETYRSHS